MDAELLTFDRGFRDYPGLRVQVLQLSGPTSAE